MRNIRASAFWFVVLLVMVAVTGWSTGAPLKITYASWAPGNVADVERNLAKVFMAQNSDIEVEYIPVDWSGEPGYAEKMGVWAAGGLLPDVLKVPYGLIPDFVKAGIISDITQFVERDAKIINLADLPIKDHCVVNGRWYGMTATHSLYWLKTNETLFAESGLASAFDLHDKGGWTWEALRTAAMKMTRYDADGRWGSLGITGPWSRLFDAPFIHQAGGAWFDAGYRKATLDTPESLAALRFWQQLAVEDKSLVWNQDSRENVMAGKIGMAFGWNPTFSLPLGTAYNWQPEFVPMPTGPQSGVTTYSAHLVGIASASKQREAAWRFTRFYGGTEKDIVWAEGFALTPDHPSQWSKYKSIMRTLYPMQRSYDYMHHQYAELVALHMPPESSRIRSIIDKELRPAMLGQRPLEEGVSQTQNQINQVLIESAGR